MMDISETIKKFNSLKKIRLSDLIDIKFLQKLQDDFAKTTSIACLIIDENGPITKPSEFAEFCNKYIKASEIGDERCHICNTKWSNLAAKLGKPLIYKCHTGLIAFVIPIIVAGKHMATIIGGQVLIKAPNEQQFRNLAKEFGINEEDYISALKKVKIVPFKNIQLYTQLLFIVANSISEMAYKNYELKEKNEREAILVGITNKIRSSLDLEEIKNTIVTLVGNFFDADRVVIAYYDYNINNYVITEKSEYKSSDNVKTFVGVNFTGMPGFTEFIRNIHFQGKNIIFNDLEKYIDENNFQNTGIEKFYRDFGFVSSAAINMSYENTFLGDLVITFENKREITEDEIKFLKAIADQAGVAFHQAELYLTTKRQAEKEFELRNKAEKQAEREMLLISIIETVRKSLDADETKKKIVNIIGATLKADRCFILEYNKANDKFLIVNEEYLSSENILHYKGVDLNEHIPSLIAEFKKGKRLIINECGSILDGEKVDFQKDSFEDVKNAIEKYKVNSALVFPLFYSGEFLGDLVLHYVELQHEISDDEINFLDLISNQIALALYQAKLYQKVQLQAEREKISRNIIEILRSTLDKNMIQHLFVRNIGKYFNANRVFFAEFDKKTNEYFPIDGKSEYLSGPEEKSFARLNLSDKDFGGHIQPLLEKRELIIPNWQKYIEKNTKTPELMALYKEANVKSSYSFPVLYEGRIMGYFCVEFTNKTNELLDEDISRLRSICTQAGIALYQAELYLEAHELIATVQSRIKEPVDNIIKASKILSEQQLEKEKQQECLNRIIRCCNKLMELTKNISDG